MTDREKTVAEIRKALKTALSRGLKSTPWIVVNAPEWLRFLLSELDRIEQEYAAERAAHNAHVAELIEKEEECRKLREERDAYYNNAKYTEAAFREVISLRSQLQSAQQERETLIEGLRNYMKELDSRYQKAHQNYDIDSDPHQLGMAEGYDIAENRLRDILKECGVTVE